MAAGGMAASNLALRFATAGVAIPLLLALLFVGAPWGWLLFLVLVAVVGGAELFGITHPGDRVAAMVGVGLVLCVLLSIWVAPDHPRVFLTGLLLLPFFSVAFTLWRLGEMKTAAVRLAATTFGPLWLGGGIGAIALLRVAPGPDGPAFVVLCLVLAWLADTGAYFAGRMFGKHKLYEPVSPSKTVEGAMGGVAGGIVGALAVHWAILPALPVRDAVLLGALASVGGMVGDLGESLLKRSVGVKDSGSIFPGHGGMLDRIDAVLVTAPLTLIYVLWFRGV
jgi:phosphatidate cytidylyltransferase